MRYSGRYIPVPLLLRLACVLLAILCAVSTARAQWVEATNIPPGFTSNYWLDVFFLPADPRYGWVCGRSSMVLRTTDGGDTWQGVILDTADLQLESIHFVSPLVGYTSGRGKIFKTTNGGTSWVNITPPSEFARQLWGCYFVSADTGVVLGGGCLETWQAFFRTTDGGRTWTQFLGSETGGVGMTDAMLYSGDGLGYASGSGTIWRTLNGGQTWSVFSRTGTTDWQEEITNIGESFLVPVSGTPCGGIDTRGGMRMSIDNGRSWRSYLTGVTMYGAFLLDTLRGWVCGDSGAAYYTPDGGLTWKKRDCGIHPTANLDDIFFITDSLGWVVGNGIFKLETRVALPTRLTVEGTTTFCEGDSVVLHAPPGYASYRWSTGETTRSIVVRASGSYYALANDSLGCPYDFDTLAVTVQPHRIPAITASGPVNFCIGDSVVLKADAGFSSYLWSTGETTSSITVRTSGSYTVSAVYQDGCSGLSDTIDVSVRPIADQLFIRTDADSLIAFDTVDVTGRFCRTVVVVNTNDTASFLLTTAMFADNVYFSLPQHQFPLLIAPGDSIRLLACYTPSQPEREYDTLVVADNCSNRRAVVFGSGRRNVYSVHADCDISLTLRTIAYDTFLLRLHPPAPNPASDLLLLPVTFTGSETDPAMLEAVLYDRLGTAVATGRAGTPRLVEGQKYLAFGFEVAHLAPGVYFAGIRTPYGSLAVPVVVSR